MYSVYAMFICFAALYWTWPLRFHNIGAKHAPTVLIFIFLVKHKIGCFGEGDSLEKHHGI